MRIFSLFGFSYNLFYSLACYFFHTSFFFFSLSFFFNASFLHLSLYPFFQSHVLSSFFHPIITQKNRLSAQRSEHVWQTLVGQRLGLNFKRKGEREIVTQRPDSPTILHRDPCFRFFTSLKLIVFLPQDFTLIMKNIFLIRDSNPGTKQRLLTKVPVQLREPICFPHLRSFP